MEIFICFHCQKIDEVMGKLRKGGNMIVRIEVEIGRLEKSLEKNRSVKWRETRKFN